MEDQNKKGELLVAIQNLKQSPGWLYVIDIISQWKEQALTEVLASKESDKQKGEFSAYSRILKLPEFITQNLSEEAPKAINLDAYQQDDKK